MKKLVERDLECLENLYFGNYFSDKNLNKRIKALAQYIPQMQNILVKHGNNSYYLFNLCEEVNRDTTGYYVWKFTENLKILISKNYNFIVVNKR